MAISRPVDEQMLVSGASSLSITESPKTRESGRFEQFSVKPVRVGFDVPCFIRKKEPGLTHLLLHAFLSVHNVFRSEELQLLKENQRVRAVEASLPNHSKTSLVISNQSQGRFSVMAFCSFQPITDHNSKVAIALKIPDGEDLSHSTLAQDALNAEISVLKKLDHPNIVPLLGYIYRPEKLPHSLMVLPRLQGSLKQLLPIVPELAFLKVKLCLELMTGLSYLYDMGYCHRDLKPDNCLIDYDLTLKLCDFGMVRKINRNGNYFSSSQAGSKGYWSPEVQTLNTDGKRTYGAKADVFAAGVIMTLIMGFHSKTLIRPGAGRNYMWISPSEYINENGEGFSVVLAGALSRRKLDQRQVMEQESRYSLSCPAALGTSMDACQKEEIAFILATCLRVNPEIRPDSLTVYENIKSAVGLKLDSGNTSDASK